MLSPRQSYFRCAALWLDCRMHLVALPDLPPSARLFILVGEMDNYAEMSLIVEEMRGMSPHPRS
jgi:hypothetical protein